MKSQRNRRGLGLRLGLVLGGLALLAPVGLLLLVFLMVGGLGAAGAAHATDTTATGGGAMGTPGGGCLIGNESSSWFSVEGSWYITHRRPHPSLLWPDDALIQRVPNTSGGWHRGHPQSGWLRYRTHPLMCTMSPPFAADTTNFRHFLHCDAWADLRNLRAAFQERFGTELGIGNGYRTIQQQVAISSSPLAATPGNSLHGWGVAVDFTGPAARFGTVEHQWMRANAGRFGWFHPTWAHANGALPEAWHWEWVSAAELGVTCQPQPSFTMPDGEAGQGDLP